MSAHQLTSVITSSCLFFLAGFIGCSQLLRLWDEFLAQSFSVPVARYRQLRMDEQRLANALRLWSVLLVAGTAALILIKSWPIVVLYAGLMAVAPPYAIEFFIRRREQLLESQLIGSSTGLANTVKAGLSIPQGLKSVAAEAPFPIRTELDQIVYQFDHGRPLQESLADARKRLQLESFTLFCLALEVAVERGGRVNVALDRLSTTLQEWFRLRRKLDSDTSAGRYAILIMGFCPAAFVLLFLVTGMHAILALFTDLRGQLVLSAIILLICLGVRWSCRIMNIKLT
jgi:tight adherence protein B